MFQKKRKRKRKKHVDVVDDDDDSSDGNDDNDNASGDVTEMTCGSQKPAVWHRVFFWNFQVMVPQSFSGLPALP